MNRRTHLSPLVQPMVMAAALCFGLACRSSSESSSDPGPSAGGAAQQARSSADDPVLAQVGSAQISLSDLQDELQSMEPEARMRFSSLERKKVLLERLVERELLAQEARRRGLGRDPEVIRQVRQALAEQMAQQLRQELVKLQQVTDEQVRAHYQQHRADMGPLAQEAPRIRNLLFKRRRQAALRQTLSRLRSEARIEIFEQRVAELQRHHQASQGDARSDASRLDSEPK